MTQTLHPEDSRDDAGFTLHSPHAADGSAIHKCVAVVVLLAGSAGFVATVILPLVNILR